MQVLLRNPLGDPYVLGVSGGAASAALFGMVLGVAGWLITPIAFVGAMVSILIVFGLSRFQSEQQTLLLAGVVMAAFWGAFISLTLSLAPPMQLPGMLFWLMGDLSDAQQPFISLLILAAGLVFALMIANQLNVAIYGEEQAHSLGINTQQLKLKLYILTSLLTASAVSIAGAIGFIGLIIPHLVRLLGVTDHRNLLPMSVLAGGSLLVLADLLARTLISPMQIPVGIFTALLGVPVFLWLLVRSRS
jgi:iron complex transport system permease protein